MPDIMNISTRDNVRSFCKTSATKYHVNPHINLETVLSQTSTIMTFAELNYYYTDRNQKMRLLVNQIPNNVGFDKKTQRQAGSTRGRKPLA